MDIGGARFDAGVTRDLSGRKGDTAFTLKVLVFGINSMETVRRIREDTSVILRDINPDLEEEVPTGKTLGMGPPSAVMRCRLPFLSGGRNRLRIQGAKFHIGVTEESPETKEDVTLALKVVVFGIDKMETVDRISRAISAKLLHIDPHLELTTMKGEGGTIN